jgi:negative regulator of flagellin synthesis FlgM
MDIRVANAYNIYGVYSTKSASGIKKAESAAKSEKTRDQFSLSSEAGDYQAVRKVLAGIPDVRTDRVNQVKAKIESGTYPVTASDVAAKILQGWNE